MSSAYCDKINELGEDRKSYKQEACEELARCWQDDCTNIPPAHNYMSWITTANNSDLIRLQPGTAVGAICPFGFSHSILYKEQKDALITPFDEALSLFCRDFDKPLSYTGKATKHRVIFLFTKDYVLSIPYWEYKRAYEKNYLPNKDNTEYNITEAGLCFNYCVSYIKLDFLKQGLVNKTVAGVSNHVKAILEVV